MTDSATELHRCAATLAGRCDHAHAQDGAGFGAFDADFGHSLAAQEPTSWSPRQTASAFKMLRKYRKQLAGAGIDFETIPAPPDPDKVEANAGLIIPDPETPGWVICRFPKSRSASFKQAAIGKRRFDWDLKRWQAEMVPTLAEWIAASGIPVEGELPEARALKERTIEIDGANALISFEYDIALVEAVKALPSRRWNKKDEVWEALIGAPDNAAAIVAFGEAHGFSGTEELAAATTADAERRDEMRTRSEADDAELEIPGLAPGMGLYPFQRAGAAYALDRRRTFIADEMGLGKTMQAIAATQAADAYPAIVIVPASLKLNWQREIEAWLPGRTAAVLSGQKPDGALPEADWLILNYDILGAGVKLVKSVDKKKKKTTTIELVEGSWLDLLVRLRPKTIIADESHYLKTPPKKAKRSAAAQWLVQHTDPELVLLLTGTPFLNRPKEGIHQLEILGRLDEFGGWFGYAKRYCKAHRTRFGWDLDGAAHLDELNRRLRETCFVRRRKADVLPELPAKRRVALPMEIDNRRAYQQAEADVAGWFASRAIEDEHFLAEIADLDPEDQRRAKAARRNTVKWKANKVEQLARFTALKQVAAQGKMAAAEEWIDNFLESGEKLVVFAHHRAIVNAVADRLKAPRITGETPTAKRQEAVDAFQNDPEVKVIVLNMEAGGVGLTLTAASNVLFLELGWTPALHDQAEDRCHRIGQDESVTAWYLLADDTIEDEVYTLLAAKRSVVDAATDGKEIDGKATILRGLIEKLMERAA